MLLEVAMDSLHGDFAIVRWETECVIPANRNRRQGVLTRERADEVIRVGTEWQYVRTRYDMVRS